MQADGGGQSQDILDYQRAQRNTTIDQSSLHKDSKLRKSWFSALVDLYLETFNPVLLLLPVMFIHIGIWRASILMVAVTFF